MTNALPPRPLAAVAASLAVGLLASGCGLLSDDGAAEDPAPPRPRPSVSSDAPEPLPPGRTGKPHGGIASPDAVDQKDATAVSRAALTLMSSYDTTLDTSRNDAGRRMAEAGWCTDDYARELRHADSFSGPGAAWSEWAKHRAYTVPKLRAIREAGQPEDTPTEAYRQWIVTLTPTGRDKWKGKPEVSTAFVYLTRTTAGDPWRLAAVTIH
ncbi:MULTISPECIES: hypothetical protein [unclassified Streptomyces]|uniref:hypothetical protein n=1 Tax=unclassified Streptomyces TaxID=2593676 RepID=UPI0033EA8DF6